MSGVIIVSPICIYREGLVRMLAHEPDLVILGQASSLERAVALIDPESPGIVLIDVASSGVLDEVRALTSRFPAIRVIALGVEERASSVTECAEAGIAAYVDRDASVETLAKTIQDAATGKLRCSPRIAAALMRRVGRLASAARATGNGAQLTYREIEVMRLVDHGLTNKEIASRLNIATATVRNHVHHVLEKLGARTRGEAAAIARRSQTL